MTFTTEPNQSKRLPVHERNRRKSTASVSTLEATALEPQNQRVARASDVVEGSGFVVSSATGRTLVVTKGVPPLGYQKPRTGGKSFPVVLRWDKILLPVLVLLGVFALEFNKIQHYTVSGDDFAVVAASRQFRPLDWLLKGYSDYFLVYPGSSKPYTNFVRPIGNLTVFLNHVVLQDHLAWYFISTAMFAAVMAILAYSMVPPSFVSFLTVSMSFSLAPSILAAFVSPVFAFDVLAAALFLGSISLLQKDRFIWAIGLALASSFTKEIGLCATLGTAFYLLVIARTRLRALLFTLPIVAYIAVRAVGVGFGGIYATAGLGASAGANVLRTIATFPTGSFNDPGNQVLQVILICMNVIFLCVLLWNAPLFLRSLRRGPSLDSLLVVILAFTSAYVAGMGLDHRFFPLPMAVVLILLLRLSNQLLFQRTLMTLWVASLVLSSVTGLIVSQKSDIAADSVFRSALGADSGDRVLIINAPFGYSSPKYVGNYYGHAGDVAFLFNTSYTCTEATAVGASAKGNGGVSRQVPILTIAVDHLELTFDGMDNTCYRVLLPGISPTLIELMQGSSSAFRVNGNLFVTRRQIGDAAPGTQSVGLSSIERVDLPNRYDRYVWIDYSTGVVMSLRPR